MQADYTQQLNAIVKALNRPATPTWIIALISTGFGVLGAFIGLWLGDFYKRYKLRRLLYRELVGMFSVVDDTLGHTFVENEHDQYKWQGDQIRTYLSFSSQEYMKANQDLYVSLAEHATAEMLYGRFHAIVDNSHSFSINTGLALRLFSRAVTEGWLKKFWLRVFLSRRGYKRIMQRVNAYWQLEEALNRNLEAAGMKPPSATDPT
jgi:hypothetical protein